MHHNLRSLQQIAFFRHLITNEKCKQVTVFSFKERLLCLQYTQNVYEHAQMLLHFFFLFA